MFALSQEGRWAQLGRFFRLSDGPGNGVSCSQNGVFVGEVPLLEWTSGLPQWRLRTVCDLNRDLSKRYGLPVEFKAKIAGLLGVARALGRGDLVHAQIATLHLQIPDPPDLTKSALTIREIVDLAGRLKASSLLKAGWDPAKHPRWPAGSSGGIGGEFSPSGCLTADSSFGEPSAPIKPAQLTIPVPFELPGGIPFPSEIVPSPLVPPNINPRDDVPRNPYPDRPECVEEWAQAVEYCKSLLDRNLLGKGDYRGMGRTFFQCVMGQVSEACGGNSTGA